MKIPIPYAEATPQQKMRAFWADFCDAEPVPPEFIDDMEVARFSELTPTTDDDLNSPFAYERGIERGGYVWRLTEAGRAALSQ